MKRFLAFLQVVCIGVLISSFALGADTTVRKWGTNDILWGAYPGTYTYPSGKTVTYFPQYFDNDASGWYITADRIGSPSFTDNGYFSDLITRGPWVDIRSYMDGASGRPTLAQWQADNTLAMDNVWTAAHAATPTGGNLRFPVGLFTFTDTPVVSKKMRLSGTSGTLHYNGTVFKQTGGATKDALQVGAGVELNDVIVENIALGGTASSRHALHINGPVNRSEFRNIALLGAGMTGMKITGQALLNTYYRIKLSMGFSSPGGYAVPTKGFDLSSTSGVSTWISCGAAGVTTSPGYGWHLNGSNTDVFIQPESENNTVGWQCDNCAGNIILWPYHEGNGTIIAGTTNSATNLSIGTTYGASTNLQLGAARGSTLLVSTDGAVGYFMMQDNTVYNSLLLPHTSPKGSLHVSRTGVTAVTDNTAVEGEVPLFAHTNDNVANVLIVEAQATGTAADVDLRIGASGSTNVGDTAIKSYRRSTGGQRNVYVGKLAVDIVTDGTLPAGATTENGRIMLNSTDNTLYYHVGGARFKLTGTLVP